MLDVLLELSMREKRFQMQAEYLPGMEHVYPVPCTSHIPITHSDNPCF